MCGGTSSAVDNSVNQAFAAATGGGAGGCGGGGGDQGFADLMAASPLGMGAGSGNPLYGGMGPLAAGGAGMGMGGHGSHGAAGMTGGGHGDHGLGGMSAGGHAGHGPVGGGSFLRAEDHAPSGWYDQYAGRMPDIQYGADGAAINMEIRAPEELMQLAAQKVNEDNPGLYEEDPERFMRLVANEATNFNDVNDEVKEALGITGDLTEEEEEMLKGVLHDPGDQGQREYQGLTADQKIAALESGALQNVVPVLNGGQKLTMNGAHTYQQDSLESELIGYTSSGAPVYENRVTSDNNNGAHTGHQYAFMSVGGPAEVEVNDNGGDDGKGEGAYNLSAYDQALVQNFMSGGMAYNFNRNNFGAMYSAIGAGAGHDH